MSSPKADLVKRFLAVLIDGLTAGVISWVFGLFGTFMSGIGVLVAAGYILTRDALETPYTDGRSFGKKIIGLRAVRLDGGPMTMETSIRRNWTLAAGSIVSGIGTVLLALGPLAILGVLVLIGSIVVGLLGLVEAVLVVTDDEGRRIGDRTGGTQVIEEAEVAATV
ncbi:RDD family protein [Rubrivirga sp.]|uniref:RDD family protein n=1 Tax=Rubrivirga sp. TaxID=1885344 RepID=UPI003C726CCF